ncbi:MAG: hypothetical protein HY815_28750 [Candidatus Riflebacteria bacterium]|nr:hypothetical protein [Candidatus Riflebacteria bacterium]
MGREKGEQSGILGLLRWLVFGGNAYDRLEFSGAFGDLGTFIPFVVAYITINKLDPLGILVAFGVCKIYVGLVFKTPMPVQPMKAIGGAAIANAQYVTHGMIWGSGIFTALFWTVMGITGAVDWLAKISVKPVIRGMMLGLGLSFVVDGLGLMRTDIALSIAALVLTFLLLTSQRFPAMLVLLMLGIVSSFALDPGLFGELGRISLRFRLPELALGQISWRDLLLGSLILGIPQVPLTLGNAILAVAAEHNQHFPGRKISVRTVALDHGLVNIVSAAIGGVPLCHGAGGMAGHLRFGARTGGSLVILGVIVLFTGLFLSDSVTLLFGLIPRAVLGVILFFTGLELAVIVRDIGSKKEDVYVMLVTGGIAIVNIGIAFAAGVILHRALEKGPPQQNLWVASRGYTRCAAPDRPLAATRGPGHPSSVWPAFTVHPRAIRWAKVGRTGTRRGCPPIRNRGAPRRGPGRPTVTTTGPAECAGRPTDSAEDPKKDSGKPIEEKCESCGKTVPAYEITSLVDDDKRRSLCGDCYFETMSHYSGEDLVHQRLEPITVKDAEGSLHTFHFRYSIIPVGYGLEAFEIKDGHPGGYQFAIGGKEDPLGLLKRLYERIRRELARTHLEKDQHGIHIKDMEVRAVVDCDLESPENLPLIWIDGKSFPWEGFGRMVMSWEGWRFKMEFYDRSDEK